MKISAVEANMRKKAFVVRTRSTEYAFPYAKLRLQPSKEDPVDEAYPDPELGKEAFTYRLLSGAEDTVHIDTIREFARDPDYLHELFVHQLTVEARKGLEESGLGKRQISRQLGTSASQLYRLLDPDNRKKSIGQMLALLHLVDRDVSLVVTDRRPKESKALKKKARSNKSKGAAGSAPSQSKAPKKTTGKKAAAAASKTLRDGRARTASKSAAGSARSQRHRKTKSRGKAKAPKK